MKSVVSETLLAQLSKEITPDTAKDISLNKWQFLHVGHRHMTLYWLNPKGEELFKEICNWRSMSAVEINHYFEESEWQKVA